MKKHGNPKVLFILKKRHYSWCRTYNYSFASGLYNSANFVHEMLNDNGIESTLVEVVDNNDIDREVTLYQPTHVILEAVWVVPSKFDVLTALHPTVTWVIRNHSDFPFVATEGNAMEWLLSYAKIPNVEISNNRQSTNDDFEKLVGDGDKVIYLPNYYHIDDEEDHHHPHKKKKKDEQDVTSQDFHVGCFGAIRALKNHLIQAIASIEYCKKERKNLFFHINGCRLEHDGDSILKNLRALFNETDFTLVEHDWLTRDDFLDLLSSMDLSLQVSLSETFCLVAADSVAAEVPLVVSPEVSWASPLFYAQPTSTESIIKTIKLALQFKRIGIWLNRQGLDKFASKARRSWLGYLQ